MRGAGGLKTVGSGCENRNQVDDVCPVVRSSHGNKPLQTVNPLLPRRTGPLARADRRECPSGSTRLCVCGESIGVWREGVGQRPPCRAPRRRVARCPAERGDLHVHSALPRWAGRRVCQAERTGECRMGGRRRPAARVGIGTYTCTRPPTHTHTPLRHRGSGLGEGCVPGGGLLFTSRPARRSSCGHPPLYIDRQPQDPCRPSIIWRPPPPPPHQNTFGSTEGQNEQWREANRRRQRHTTEYRGLVPPPPPTNTMCSLMGMT